MIRKELISPRSIAVIGASEDVHKPGGALLANLLRSSFNGDIYVVNPKADTVQGVKSYHKAEDLPDVDLGILAIPAHLCEESVRILCEEKHCGAIIIISAGFGENSGGDPGRVAAQVVTGIGFIGAGSIMIHKQFVRGLTTASGLWATAGIGLAVGGGMYGIGVAATVLTLAGLELSTLVFRSIGLHTSLLVFSTSDEENLSKILAQIHEKGYNLVSYEASHDSVGEGRLFRVTMVVKTRNYADDTHLFHFMQSLPGLTIEKME